MERLPRIMQSLAAAAALVPALSLAAEPPASSVSKDTGQVFKQVDPGMLVHRSPAADFQPTAAYRWLEFLLEASGRDAVRNKPRPTVLSRADAIVLTAMYDAWAAYDDKAVGTRLGGKLRRPKSERILANKERAIAFAAFRALTFLYPEDESWLQEQFRGRGFNPDETTRDLHRPEGVGNTAAQALIDYRRHDGANQLGDESGSSGKAYADYTGYAPVNSPGKVVDPLRWQPIPFSDGKGGTVTPPFLSAQWGKIKPFALERPDQFRPPPPPGWGSAALNADVEEAVSVNANLTLEQKATVEFMREGPRSTGQSGHWLQFAQDVSRRDHDDLDRDIKLFFVVGNVVMDAFIACWEAKRVYDASRPYWWAQLYYQGKQIEAWAGPGKGTRLIPASDWRPYSPATFVTPPFPGYPSGHATASGAASRILELFTGSDRYGAVAFQEARISDRRGRRPRGPDAVARRKACDERPRVEGGSPLLANVHRHRGDGSDVSPPRRVPCPRRQRGGSGARAEDCNGELAEVPGLLRGHGQSSAVVRRSAVPAIQSPLRRETLKHRGSVTIFRACAP